MESLKITKSEIYYRLICCIAHLAGFPLDSCTMLGIQMTIKSTDARLLPFFIVDINCLAFGLIGHRRG